MTQLVLACDYVGQCECGQVNRWCRISRSWGENEWERRRGGQICLRGQGGKVGNFKLLHKIITRPHHEVMIFWPRDEFIAMGYRSVNNMDLELFCAVLWHDLMWGLGPICFTFLHRRSFKSLSTLLNTHRPLLVTPHCRVSCFTARQNAPRRKPDVFSDTASRPYGIFLL